jgi:hypothetical protein
MPTPVTKHGCSFCSHCHKVGHSHDTCWTFLRSNGLSEKADALKAATKRKKNKRKKSGAKEYVAASAEFAETFYTALTSSSTNSYHVGTVPSSILDTGSIGLITGKEVLHRYMEQLALTSVRTVDDSNHRVHNLGTNGEPLKILFSCEFPWNADQTDGECFPFQTGVDLYLVSTRSCYAFLH